MNADFRHALLPILNLPSNATDDDILARAAQVAADSSALVAVEYLAKKAERKCNDTLWTAEVLDAINPDRGTR